MTVTLEEYLKRAPERDTLAATERAKAEKVEDVYFEAISSLVDQCPVGHPVSRGGCHGLE